MADIYSREVLKHFKKPHNMGRMKDPDAVGKVGNPVCGDVMWVYIKVGKNSKGEEVLKDVKFQTFGCVAAIATSSAITDMAKGKTLKDALNITNRDVVKALKGLPPLKLHCSNLAATALVLAIKDYIKKKK